MVMMALIAIFVVICVLISVNVSQWVSSNNSVLPLVDQAMAVGYYNNTIVMIGGEKHQTNIVEYNINNSQFILYNDTLSASIRGWSQYWAQPDTAIFLIHSQYICSYDLKSKNLTVITTIPINVTKSGDSSGTAYACLAANHDVLYVVGGYDKIHTDGVYSKNTLQIYNITSANWTFGPLLIEERRSFACIHTNNNELYVIGGDGGRHWRNHLSSIEYIITTNITNNSWKNTNGNLSIISAVQRAVAWERYIFIIGGNSWSTDPRTYLPSVHVIDTQTHDVWKYHESLVFAQSGAAVIALNNRIYAFGGDTHAGVTNKYQYIDLLRFLFSTTGSITTLHGTSLYPLVTDATATAVSETISPSTYSVSTPSSTGSASTPPSTDSASTIAIIVTATVLLVLCMILIYFLRKSIAFVDNDLQCQNAIDKKQSELVLVRAHNADEVKVHVMHDHEQKEVKERKEHTDIRQWLQINVGLEEYFTNFIECGYNRLDIIKQITVVQELVEIEIHSVAHQDILMKEILKLRKENASHKVSNVCTQSTTVGCETTKDMAQDIRRKTCDQEKQYVIGWNTQNVLDWILTLENGIYKKYMEKLAVAFNDEEVDGNNIQKIDAQDLRQYGVNSLSDRKALLVHFQNLINSEVYENQLEGHNHP